MIIKDLITHLQELDENNHVIMQYFTKEHTEILLDRKFTDTEFEEFVHSAEDVFAGAASELFSDNFS